MTAMKVQDLQRFVNLLREPLSAVGAAEKTMTEIARLASCLEPFREVTLVDFADFLVNAQTAVQTGHWPALGKKPAATRAAKAPKLSVEEMAQKTMEIYERAAADPTLDFAVIDSFIDSLAPMTKPQLKELAKQVDVTVSSKAGKDEILRAMKESIKSRKGRPERTTYGAEMVGQNN